MSVALDDTAFYELMAEALPEMEAADAEDARQAVLDPDKWEWLKARPMSLSQAQNARDEFRAYLTRYIEQLQEVHLAFGPNYTLPDDHIAAKTGREILQITTFNQSLDRASAEMQKRWSQPYQYHGKAPLKLWDT